VRQEAGREDITMHTRPKDKKKIVEKSQIQIEGNRICSKRNEASAGFNLKH